MTAMLEIADLSAGYGEVRGFDAVSLGCRSGSPVVTPDVMAGLVPAIHVTRHRGASGEGTRRRPYVDARNKSGHDDGGARRSSGATTVSPPGTEPVPKVNRTATGGTRE